MSKFEEGTDSENPESEAISIAESRLGEIVENVRESYPDAPADHPLSTLFWAIENDKSVHIKSVGDEKVVDIVTNVWDDENPGVGYSSYEPGSCSIRYVFTSMVADVLAPEMEGEFPTGLEAQAVNLLNSNEEINKAFKEELLEAESLSRYISHNIEDALVIAEDASYAGVEIEGEPPLLTMFKGAHPGARKEIEEEYKEELLDFYVDHVKKIAGDDRSISEEIVPILEKFSREDEGHENDLSVEERMASLAGEFENLGKHHEANEERKNLYNKLAERIKNDLGQDYEYAKQAAMEKEGRKGAVEAERPRRIEVKPESVEKPPAPRERSTGMSL